MFDQEASKTFLQTTFVVRIKDLRIKMYFLILDNRLSKHKVFTFNYFEKLKNNLIIFFLKNENFKC